MEGINFAESKSKKACLGCPFKKINTNEKPNPGGSHPFVYLGQAHGPFWLPCHQDKNYQGKGSDTATVAQCRGAAIFRSNIGVADKMPPQLLKLEEDKENIFANETEFLEHYLDISEDEAKVMTRPELLAAMAYKEITQVSPTKRIFK